jgi:hypothetical protein
LDLSPRKKAVGEEKRMRIKGAGGDIAFETVEEVVEGVGPTLPWPL